MGLFARKKERDGDAAAQVERALRSLIESCRPASRGDTFIRAASRREEALAGPHTALLLGGLAETGLPPSDLQLLASHSVRPSSSVRAAASPIVQKVGIPAPFLVPDQVQALGVEATAYITVLPETVDKPSRLRISLLGKWPNAGMGLRVALEGYAPRALDSSLQIDLDFTLSDSPIQLHWWLYRVAEADG